MGPLKKSSTKIQRNFAMKHQDPKGFPSDRNQVNYIFAVRSEHFAYSLCVRPVRQRLHATKCTRKGRTLKRSHQLEHSVSSSPLTVITNLRRRENDAGRHGKCID
jgi:hypothetical protein